MKRIYLTLMVCLTFCCFSCKEKVPELTLQQKVAHKMSELTQMSELGSVEYTITKIVKASDDKQWNKKLFGNRKIAFSCTAYLKAGIDLSLLSVEDVQVDSTTKSAVVTLPHAKVLSLNIPAEEITMVYQKVSTTRCNFSSAERNELLRQGETDIIESIPDLGILNVAEKNAQLFFKTMLSQMGFQSVTVKFE